MTCSSILIAAAALVLATAAAAQTKYPAVLEGQAVLPALTLVPPPADAPADLAISGRYAGPPGQRDLASWPAYSLPASAVSNAQAMNEHFMHLTSC